MCDGLYNSNRQLRMVFAQFILRKYEEKKYYYPLINYLLCFGERRDSKSKKKNSLKI